MHVPLLSSSTPRVYLYLHAPTPHSYRFPLIFRPNWIFSIYQWCRSALIKSAQTEIGCFEMHQNFGLWSLYISRSFCISALLPQGLRSFLLFLSDSRLHSHCSDTNSIVPVLSGLVLSVHIDSTNPTVNRTLPRPYWAGVRAVGFLHNNMPDNTISRQPVTQVQKPQERKE